MMVSRLPGLQPRVIEFTNRFPRSSVLLPVKDQRLNIAPAIGDFLQRLVPADRSPFWSDIPRP